jgi:hypothetical protein
MAGGIWLSEPTGMMGYVERFRTASLKADGSPPARSQISPRTTCLPSRASLLALGPSGRNLVAG